MNQYAIGLYEKAIPKNMSWSEKLLCAKDCNYDFLEISIDETEEKLSRLNWTKEQRREILDLMRNLDLPIRSMCLSAHRKYPFGASEKAVRDRGMETMEKAIAFADDLGIRIIQLAGYDVYYEEGNEKSRERFIENLEKATKMAATRRLCDMSILSKVPISGYIPIRGTLPMLLCSIIRARQRIWRREGDILWRCI